MLTLEAIYTDKALGKLVYIGRIGYELNIRGVKGRAVFVVQRCLSLVILSKKEIDDLI